MDTPGGWGVSPKITIWGIGHNFLTIWTPYGRLQRGPVRPAADAGCRGRSPARATAAGREAGSANAASRSQPSAGVVAEVFSDLKNITRARTHF